MLDDALNNARLTFPLKHLSPSHSFARPPILPRAVLTTPLPAVRPLHQEQPLPQPPLLRAAPLPGGGGGVWTDQAYSAVLPDDERGHVLWTAVHGVHGDVRTKGRQIYYSGADGAYTF